MFGKHFASMYTGSLFGKPALVFAVWGYVIANQRPSRRDGVCTVEINPMMLAPMFSTSLEDVVAAIGVLLAPDAASRTEDEDGRRLILEGGIVSGPATYRVVNGPKYRAMRDEEARREQTRVAVRRHRENSPSKQRKPSKPRKAHAEAEVEAEEESDAERESDAREDARLPPLGPIECDSQPQTDARPVSRETIPAHTAADECDLEDPEPPIDPAPALLKPLLVWDAWLATAHGGRDAGHYPRAQATACCEVLIARHLGIPEFSAAANAWAEQKKKQNKPPRFDWFAADLAMLLDYPDRRAGERRKGAPAPVSAAAEFKAEDDGFAALQARTTEASHG